MLILLLACLQRAASIKAGLPKFLIDLIFVWCQNSFQTIVRKSVRSSFNRKMQISLK